MQCIVHLLFIYLQSERELQKIQKYTCCYTRIIHQCLNQPYQIFCQKFAGKSANEWSCRTNSALIVQVTKLNNDKQVKEICFAFAAFSTITLLLMTLIFNVHAVALHFHTALLLENLKNVPLFRKNTIHTYGPDIFFLVKYNILSTLTQFNLLLQDFLSFFSSLCF